MIRVDLYRGFSDNTWGVFTVELPLNTPEEQIASDARQMAYEQIMAETLVPPVFLAFKKWSNV